MNVSELIELLKQWPDQNDQVVYTYASETDGCIVYSEVEELKPLIYEDIYNHNAKVKAVELI